MVRVVARGLSIPAGEIGVAALSAAAVFTFFLGYGMIRPLRDAMGVEKGFDQVKWLMTATMAAMLAVSPCMAWVVARVPRRRVTPTVFRSFAVMLLGFALAKWLTPMESRYRVGYVFYVWASVFNMACVSAFWSLMADVFSRRRALRLYGLISLGATLGLMGGAVLSRALARIDVSPIVYFLVLAAMLEVGARLAGLVPARAGRNEVQGECCDAMQSQTAGRATGGDQRKRTRPLSGIMGVLRSPYLLGVSGYLLIYTLTSTFYYLAQQKAVMEAGADTAARTAINATIDLWANGVTLALQLLFASRIIGWIGHAGALAVTPMVTLGGVLWMGRAPELGAIVPAVVARRGLHYAVDRPGREALFTVVSPDLKFTAKSFIDTFVYRGGDVLGAWVDAALRASNTPMVILAAPLCMLGVVLGAWLGRRAAKVVPGATTA